MQTSQLSITERYLPFGSTGQAAAGPNAGRCSVGLADSPTRIPCVWGWHSLPGRHVLTIINSQLMLLIRNMTEMCLFMGTALFVPHLQNTAVQARIQPAAALTPSSIGTQCTAGWMQKCGTVPTVPATTSSPIGSLAANSEFWHRKVPEAQHPPSMMCFLESPLSVSALQTQSIQLGG